MDDPLGWGGPKEIKVDFRMIEALLATANSGCDVLRLMPEDPDPPEFDLDGNPTMGLREVRLEKTWSLVERAEGMILRELSRRRKRAKDRARENEAMTDMDFSDVEDDEEEEGDPAF